MIYRKNWLILLIVMFFPLLSCGEEANYCDEIICSITKHDKESVVIVRKLSDYQHICDQYHSYQRMLAGFYIKHDLFQKAAEILERSIAYNSDNLKKQSRFLANAYLNLEMLDKVKKLADRVVAKYPLWSGGYYILGKYSISQNDFAAAQANFEKAVALNTNDVLPYLYLGKLNRRKKNYKEVINIFTAALLIQPSTALIDYGICYQAVVSCLALGKPREAKIILDEQLHSNKNAELSESYQKALKLYQQAANRS